jgi:hypothetical protein
LPTVAELAQQELSRRYSLQGRTQVAPRVQTMQNARPTVRSALSNLMRDAVDATGLEGGYRQGLLNAAGGVETAVDFLPVVGDVLGLEDASRAYGQGDMVGAGINMMGVVPVVGDVAAKGAKTARSALRNVIPVGHASPHRFEQFSMDKIGTGEGAQVYGHGLYFAENPTVVDEYFNQFNSPVLRFKEKNVDTPYTAELRDRFKDVYEGLIDDDLTQQWKLNVLDAASDAGLSADEVADKLDVLIKNVFEGSETVRDFSFMKWDKLGIDPNEVYDLANNQLLLDNVLGGISQAKTMNDLQYVVESYSPDEMRLYKNLVEPELAEIRDSASRYDVNLNVSPEDLLDLDATLSQQPKKVQDMWQKFAKSRQGKASAKENGIEDIRNLVPRYGNEITGEDIRQAIYSGQPVNFNHDYSSNIAPQENKMTSEYLQRQGIKGIRYLDGFSRNAKEGTRNYVIFDDSLIDTKRVNDQLTPSWMNPEARMQRAQDLGFDTSRPLYHSTNASFDSFEIPEGGFLKYGEGVYTTPKPQYADRYIRENRDLDSAYKEGANVMPLYARGKIATEKDWEAARQEMMSEGVTPSGYNPQQAEIQRRLKEQGFDGLNMFGDEIIIFDPKNLRSTNAEFDPAKADSADLLSSVGATSALRGIV